MAAQEDIYLEIKEIIAQVKGHLEYQRELGIRTLLSQETKKERLTLDAVRRELGACTRCPLHEGRNHLVFGEGDPHARLVFVGEGPGREEDLQGKPFVGRAGELLTRIIEAIDLTREQVYIANIVKCRPPHNRDPRPDEIQACFPFLIKQLQAIRPRIICALGSFAAQTLLGTEEKISALRGRFHRYQGAKLMPTYHPAFLLRNPQFKKAVWEDMKMIREEYTKG
jgi:uracil-DNA glycosylase family 4